MFHDRRLARTLAADPRPAPAVSAGRGWRARDGAWRLGAWRAEHPDADQGAIHAHLRAWGVKAFFLAFMVGQKLNSS